MPSSIPKTVCGRLRRSFTRSLTSKPKTPTGVISSCNRSNLPAISLPMTFPGRPCAASIASPMVPGNQAAWSSKPHLETSRSGFTPSDPSPLPKNPSGSRSSAATPLLIPATAGEELPDSVIERKNTAPPKANTRLPASSGSIGRGAPTSLHSLRQHLLLKTPFPFHPQGGRCVITKPFPDATTCAPTNPRPTSLIPLPSSEEDAQMARSETASSPRELAGKIIRAMGNGTSTSRERSAKPGKSSKLHQIPGGSPLQLGLLSPNPPQPQPRLPSKVRLMCIPKPSVQIN